MISDNLNKIRQSLSETVTLVAVSKTKPVSYIQEAYDAGQRVFGENKAQELAQKAQELPKDINWHFIGHLQTNKVKYIALYAQLIHSIDSFKLLKEVNKQALKNNRVIDCLLQFHIATEISKFGLSLEESDTILNSDDFAALKNIRIIGVMGMASFISDENQVKKEFAALKNNFLELKNNFFKNSADFKTISMGMSGDYKIAIEAGSNMVRIGSLIFGNRN